MSQRVQVIFGEQKADPRTKELEGLSVKVFAVDGEVVRKDQDIEFTMAGHNFDDMPYIPKNEVWIDQSYLDSKEWNAILLHELVEMFVMDKFGLDYDTAHEIANTSEGAVRAVIQEK